MRLKKIKLAGFKSFVDPTHIALPGDLIGVVGPNGCGKSNIIDAVRWVMGESSAKHLRGDSMADVIFNGSTARKPVGQASIELIFDNSDGSAGGQYAAYNEIAIKRIVTREGQSNYFLNSTRCRRRDVTDIFLGTGLGPRSYAIIEQGMISRLIEAKPDELRALLEEAAGISKYKERRRETENRLRHTRENLSRLNDIREEVSKRIAVLDRQAKAAEKYKVLKAESRELKVQALALRWQVLQADVTKQQTVLRENENRLEREQAELRKIEANLEKQRQSRAEEEGRLNVVQANYYELGADIARLEELLNGAKAKKEQQRSQLAGAETALAEANRHIEEDGRKVTELRQSLSENEPHLQQLSESEHAAVSALAELEALMQSWQRQWDNLTAQSAEHTRLAEVERERSRHLEQRRTQLTQQIEGLDGEISAIRLADGEQEIGVLQASVSSAGSEIDQLKQAGEQHSQAIQEKRQQRSALERELEQIRQQHQRLARELAALEGLQQAALGGKQEKVREWLARNGLADAKRVANIIEVDEGWERAVESVLDFHLQAVCVDDLGAHADALGGVEQGELELLSLAEGAVGAGEKSLDSLASRVRAPAPVLDLLAGIYVCESMAEALAMRSRLDANESVVTRDGVWLNRAWARILKSADEAAGVLAREKAIHRLQQESAVVAKRLDSLKEELTAVAEAIDTAQRKRDDAQRTLSEHVAAHAALREKLNAKKIALEQLRGRRERMQTQLAQWRDQLENTENDLGSVQLRLHDALEKTQHFDVSRGSLTEQRDEHISHLGTLRVEAQKTRDAKHQLALQVESTRTQLRLTESNLQRLRDQLQQIVGRCDELRTLLASADAPIDQFSSELQAKLEQRLQVESQLNELRNVVNATDNELLVLDKKRHEIDREIEAVRSRVEALRVQMGELNVRCTTIVEQIEENDYQVAQVVEGLPEGANAEEWTQRLDKIEVQIRRLEPVNLAAIDEFQSETERKSYLDAQFDDLTEAITTLEGAIQKIDRETRMRFKETFDKVNNGIKEKFPRLFGGGQAYLEMTGTDLLDTGVTVMARPPGKRNSTIHLLSGGEKALTAVAMVFAIFELTPAPFCMLDEVDAPLDDANVGRFCELVKEMSQRVQFIFVTHNKITMELADQLLGVTMNEPGVSRLVAVDVDEAVAMTNEKIASNA